MSIHTAGPWNDGIYHAVVQGGRTFAYITSSKLLVPIAAVPLGVEGYGREEGEANARLIAASPSMLSALKQAAPIWPLDAIPKGAEHRPFAVLARAIHDAIAAAEGR